MAVFRKENGSLVRKAGKALIDMALNATSHNAVANSAVTTAINQVNSDLTNYESITLTPATGVNIVSSSCYIHGTKVHIEFMCTLSADKPQSERLATINKGYPLNNIITGIYTSTVSGANYANAMGGYVSKTGDIGQRISSTVPSGATVTLYIEYFIK